MAKLTDDSILHLARLSKISLSEEEIVQYKSEINTILTYIEQLSSVDIDGLEPTSQVTGLQNVLREDEIIDYAETPAELLKNAPAQQDGQFKVKRVLG